MCPINSYDKFHATSYDSISNLGVKPLPGGSTSDAPKDICDTLKFVDIWL